MMVHTLLYSHDTDYEICLDPVPMVAVSGEHRPIALHRRGACRSCGKPTKESLSKTFRCQISNSGLRVRLGQGLTCESELNELKCNKPAL